MLSQANGDTAKQFYFWREFTSTQLRSGHIALWNPHLYSGTTYIGNFQSALFYPPNYCYLLLPLERAINFEFVLHLALAGFGMYFWMVQRRLHPLACLLAAVIISLGGPYIYRYYVGHLPTLDAMAWAPLIFMSLDGYLERRSPGYLLLGMGAVALQLLAGHPQTVFNTTLASFLFTVLYPLPLRKSWRLSMGVIAVFGVACALSAIELLPGLATAAEGSRATGLSFADASLFSFPPENLITFSFPHFFGGTQQMPYWGRWYLCEAMLFMGGSGFLLALYGIVFSWRRTNDEVETESERGNRSLARRLTVVALLLFCMALGDQTPLFHLLYNYLPGFSKFRGHSKLMLPAYIFLAFLAAYGFDALLRTRLYVRRTALLSALIAIVSALAGGWIWRSSQDGNAAWGTWLYHFETLRGAAPWNTRDVVAHLIAPAGLQAAHALWWGATIFSLLALLLALGRRSTYFLHAIGILAIGELMFFTVSHRISFRPQDTPLAQITRQLEAHPGDYRIVNMDAPDSALACNGYDIWGYDPIRSTRYNEFILATQGIDPSVHTMDIPWTRLPRIYSILRLSYVFRLPQNRLEVGEVPGALPHVLLVRNYIVHGGRDQILADMAQPGFDPARTVMLETEPVPPPAPTAAGSARLVNVTTDSLTIEADVTHPCILLVTDTYNRDWQVRGLAGSAQQTYRIQPADYVLRAVPLEAGHHLLRMEYAPASFRSGAWISALSLVAYLVALALYFRGALSRRVALLT